MAQHTYTSYNSGVMTLHIIKTNASNIKLVNLQCNNNLSGSGYLGINGGFFNPAPLIDALNIAYTNGAVVGPKSTDGDNNGWNGAGAIHWVNSLLGYSVNIQNATDIAQITNSDSWAQGGYSMHIGNSQWKALGKAEMGGTGNNIMTGTATGRSAMVGAIATGEVYLIVTSASASFETFRTAIQKYFGINDGSRDNASYCGIFLDGSGSSQLRAKKTDGSIVSVTGDGRNLCQIIALRNQN